MKKIYIPLLASAIALPVLTGCIEEVTPTTVVTQDQVVESPKATESYAFGMPAFNNSVFILGSDSYHFDFGYPSMMHIRDVMTGDMAIVPSGYDWFDSWAKNEAQGESMLVCQVSWNTFTQIAQTANLTLGSIDRSNEDELSAEKQYYLGAALAWRAFAYLDMARLYEFLPNDAIKAESNSGNSVLNLTVPIVTEETDREAATDNPRATREEMLEFILNDLTDAEKFITAKARPNKTLPDLAVVYGLFARAYMWVENYPKAKEYARKAISAFSGTPTTKEQWLSTTDGFNNLNTPSWMWGGQLTSDDNAVLTGIINWTSFCANETTFGYASAEPFVMIDASLYNSISDDDFRKLTFVAPKKSPLQGQENYIDNDYLQAHDINIPEYGSLKIKPGQGNMDDNSVACAVGYPLMRIEEMYLIEAEAAAHSNQGEGKSLLESFMKNYRYSSYTCPTGDVVDEVFKQKRIEFFGEGLIFFDYKRLNKSVTRYYTGTNFAEDRQFNTNGRPAWMNFVIVQSEQNNNKAVMGYNNPDPSNAYKSLGMK
ncbi:MAG: RagB/SusD family nutrient uptake outer membrane protein [Bacteroidales bacterium]|nr:RagB/SusD family nutrient uptake outer membrane protein [Bacteroidales bacterium]